MKHYLTKQKEKLMIKQDLIQEIPMVSLNKICSKIITPMAMISMLEEVKIWETWVGFNPSFKIFSDKLFLVKDPDPKKEIQTKEKT